MAIISLTIGFISIFAIIIAFLPFLGFLHWFVVPLSVVGFFLGLSGWTKNRKSSIAKGGMTLCGLAIIVGIIKLAGFLDIFV
ncbi:MAG: hypothetical protein E4H31_02070 [Dehalococcoidia bacterium]|nr:MAG: hypothetical protein E4H31_02070 [Dehalococcoidia bacterium]